MRRRRRLDLDQTYGMYERRIAALPEDCFRELEGAFLSTFDVYGTILPEAGSIEVPPGMKPCTAFIIARVARELHGVHVRGIVSERRKHGQYLCPRLPDHRYVYVGQYNFFTGHTDKSVWQLARTDKVYGASP